ncbi:YesL family protein [Paraliobacillus sediminis]|uniref:YesL family protein n=1 Tax=Paraliobacillus sediminis TaxID=1885916 RepID=UPI000E3CB83F|nr:DUF624 domain-containing protein [Paraliobacillus sediminis]
MNTMMSGLFRMTEWIMRFSVVNLLWLAFNLPIVLLLVSAIYAEGVSPVFAFIPIIILAPFLFFPATTAMFAMVRDWIMEKEQKFLIFSYWKYYRANYKNSLISGLVLTLVWTVLVVDFYFFQQENVILFFTFILFGIVLYVYTLVFFSVLVHYDIKLRAVFKNSLSLTLGSPILFIAVLVTSLIILYVSINGMLFLLVFFTGSLIAFISFAAFYRLYIKLTN